MLEDCAPGHGASLNGQRVGTFGHAAAFSFYPTKNLGALGDGGAISTADPQVAERARLLRMYGWRQRYLSEEHGTVSRLDEIQAALLGAKLELLEARNCVRRALAARHSAGLAGLPLRPVAAAAGCETNNHLYVVRLLARRARPPARSSRIGASRRWCITRRRCRSSRCLPRSSFPGMLSRGRGRRRGDLAPAPSGARVRGSSLGCVSLDPRLLRPAGTMNEQEYRAMYGLEEDHWWYVGMRAITAALLESAPLPEAPRVLDAGCGTGFNLGWLRTRGARVSGIDFYPDALHFSRLRGERALARASVVQLPFSSCVFDLVTSFDVVSHVREQADRNRSLAEFRRVLRPGGVVLVRVAAFEWLRSSHDNEALTYRRFALGEPAPPSRQPASTRSGSPSRTRSCSPPPSPGGR